VIGYAVPLADEDSPTFESLGAHIRELHERMMVMAPGLDRVACALYEQTDDVVKTFVNSTREGEALRSYEAKLSDSFSLSALAESGETRVLTDLPNEINTGTLHSDWVLGMGYQSSLTIPLKFQDHLLGFLFFDSKQPDTFTPSVQRELALYGRLIGLAISNELIVIRSILGSVQVAQEFAQMRDIETGAHLTRISRYARVIAKALAPTLSRSDEWVEAVFLYSPLHDIGKIGIPDTILLKPGPLTDDERRIMETHTTRGLELVNSITERLAVQNAGSAQIMRNIVELHHEALNGTGYPYGLAGDDIPLEAQVVSIADVFDALTSVRPYKPEWAIQDALEELDSMVTRGKLRGDGVAALHAHLDEVREIHAKFHEDWAIG
jgi:HD-GYP domain-containing protein (c-di-GMP phosphodiesterase class II)